jgi:hypothetical protein|tara:strand:- start:328 stop:513 length:186 start_codon:yes stop_codon:yes gene_type:complete
MENVVAMANVVVWVVLVEMRVANLDVHIVVEDMVCVILMVQAAVVCVDVTKIMEGVIVVRL